MQNPTNLIHPNSDTSYSSGWMILQFNYVSFRMTKARLIFEIPEGTYYNASKSM